MKSLVSWAILFQHLSLPLIICLLIALCSASVLHAAVALPDKPQDIEITYVGGRTESGLYDPATKTLAQKAGNIAYASHVDPEQVVSWKPRIPGTNPGETTTVGSSEDPQKSRSWRSIRVQVLPLTVRQIYNWNLPGADTSEAGVAKSDLDRQGLNRKTVLIGGITAQGVFVVGCPTGLALSGMTTDALVKPVCDALPSIQIPAWITRKQLPDETDASVTGPLRLWHARYAQAVSDYQATLVDFNKSQDLLAGYERSYLLLFGRQESLRAKYKFKKGATPAGGQSGQLGGQALRKSADEDSEQANIDTSLKSIERDLQTLKRSVMEGIYTPNRRDQAMLIVEKALVINLSLVELDQLLQNDKMVVPAPWNSGINIEAALSGTLDKGAPPALNNPGLEPKDLVGTWSITTKEFGTAEIEFSLEHRAIMRIKEKAYLGKWSIQERRIRISWSGLDGYSTSMLVTGNKAIGVDCNMRKK